MLILLQRLRLWLWRRRWPVALALLPFAYVAAVTLPHPFGLGLQHGNDFQGHRIWWTDLATWYLKQGHVPLWTPSLDYGTLFYGHYGHGFFYAPGWWLHPFHAPEIPAWQTGSHYLQICLHMAVCLLGVYRLLRTRAGISEPAAVLGSALLLINHRFHDFVRYPDACEAMAWIPWMLLITLRMAEGHSTVTGPVRRLDDFLKLTLLTALSWTAGYGQLTYIGGLLIGIAGLMCTMNWRGTAAAAAAALTGTLLSVGPLAPTALMASLSPDRGGGNFSFATQNPLAMSYMNMLAHPFSADVHASSFLPPAMLGLAAAGMFSAWTRKNRRVSLAFLLGTLLIMDLSQGEDGWLCRFAYEHLPMYSAFRIQGRNNWIALLALCWFAGLGAERAIGGDKRQRLGALSLIFLVPAVGAIYHSLTEAPEAVTFSAVTLGEMTPSIVRYSFWMMLGGGTLMTLAAVWTRMGVLRFIALTGLVWCFVFFHGRHTTWFRPLPSTKIHPSFPTGMLAPYRVGFGLTSHCLVDDHFADLQAQVMKATGGMSARFPASRFLFIPDGAASTSEPTLALDSYGPNHIDATVHTEAPGRLIYLNTSFPGWKGSPQPETAPPPFDRFMSFSLSEGTTKLQLSFAPLWLLACGTITTAGIPLIAAWLFYRRQQRRLAAIVFLAGMLFTGFFLYGGLNRQSMSRRALFGPGNAGWDPALRVPILRLPDAAS